MQIILLLLILSISAAPSSFTITGTVLDKASQPLEGASVYLDGSNLQTTTGNHGEFTISPDDNTAFHPDSSGKLIVSKEEQPVYQIKVPFIDTTLSIQLQIKPAYFTSRIDSIPDYFQRDNAYGGFPNKGAVYCGPVAVSNSLMWMAQNGYPRIFDISLDLKKDQHELISQLGSRKYINTGSKGSSPANICTGVQKFMHDKGYPDARVSFYGFRDVPGKFRAGHQAPDLDLAREATFQNKAVWLNIGWYNYDKRKNEYKRNGGHWVAMVGYGFKGKRSDPDCLIVHDSESRFTYNNYLSLEKIENGTLIYNKGKTFEAAGYHNYHVSSKTYGIIDGLIIMEMPEKEPGVIAEAHSK